MILGAALLVLVALALFVGGIATGATALYWACVAVSAVAAILLVLSRRQLGRPASQDAAPSRAGGAGPGAPRTDAGPARAGEVPPVQRTGPPPFPPPAAHRDADEAQVPDAEAREAQDDDAEVREAAPEPVEETGMMPHGDGVVPSAAQMPSGTTSVTDGTAAPPPARRTVDEEDDPAIEEVEVTDLLLVMDLHDEVVVVDEHPRYHLAGCRWLRGRTAIPLPIDEARTDGFTPCAVCEPDRHLAAVERKRRTGRGAS